MFFSLWGFRLRVPQSLDPASYTLNSSRDSDPQETVYLSNGWEEQGDPNSVLKTGDKDGSLQDEDELGCSLQVTVKWLHVSAIPIDLRIQNQNVCFKGAELCTWL